MTATGKAVGTPAYMAPEVLDGKKACAASDVYAAGLVLYRMLAGRLPFDLPEESSILALVTPSGAPMNGVCRMCGNVSTLPDGLALTMGTLGRDPATRPHDGNEMAAPGVERASARMRPRRINPI